MSAVLYAAAALSAMSLAMGTVATTPVNDCPIFGPSFPATFDISSAKTLHNAKKDFPGQIEDLFSEGYLNKTHSVFAIDVFSTATNASLYTYYHVGSAMEDTLTAGDFNEHTISRIGSVSKLFTVYSLLATSGYGIFNDPVTKYIPELSSNKTTDPLDNIRWEDITVGALASQQAGIGGAPAVSTQCWDTPKGCNNEDFLRWMRDEKRPVMPSFQTAIYSDASFITLGRILERITGLPYDKAIKSALSQPLGLNATGSYKSTDKDINAVILPGNTNQSSWGYDNQVSAPSGGIYTNLADLRAIGLSILNSELLPSTETRRWMKPHSATESPSFLVGAPWEINRLQLPVSPGSDRTRLSDLYTKMGANTGYSGGFALSSDHGIGYSLLAVGPYAGDERFPLRDIVGSVFLPAAEAAAAENAVTNFAGTFVDEKNEQTNLTLVVDDDHPGLRVKSLFEDGADTRSTVWVSPVAPGTEYVVRLYPTNSSPATTSLHPVKGRVSMAFRSRRETLPLKTHTKPAIGRGIFMDDCITWFVTGFAENLDEFVFEIVDGRVESVRRSFSGSVFKRVDG